MKNLAFTLLAAAGSLASFGPSAHAAASTYPKEAGNYFRIVGSEDSPQFEIAVVKGDGTPPVIVSAKMSPDAQFGGEAYTFGSCGDISLSKFPDAIQTSNSGIKTMFVTGDFGGKCDMYPTPKVLKRAD